MDKRGKQAGVIRPYKGRRVQGSMPVQMQDLLYTKASAGGSTDIVKSHVDNIGGHLSENPRESKTMGEARKAFIKSDSISDQSSSMNSRSNESMNSAEDK